MIFEITLTFTFLRKFQPCIYLLYYSAFNFRDCVNTFTFAFRKSVELPCQTVDHQAARVRAVEIRLRRKEMFMSHVRIAHSGRDIIFSEKLV